ncbi:MAG TPA: adenylate/guanylate cyclase domain-containing protein [Saprospiraceae bacterium]|nr:adenylate/guanylate cyclase domain-containing protein [Saprospiraceae bacterium]
MQTLRFILIFFLLTLWSLSASGQSTSELEQQIRQSTDNEERMYLYYELAQKYSRKDDRIKAAREASNLAFRVKNYDMQSRSSLMLGNLLRSQRQTANAQRAYEDALGNAKKAKNIDLFIQAVDAMGTMKVREGNYSAAYNIYKENFNFLSKSGVNLLDAEKEEAKVRSRSTRLTKESDRLELERKKLIDAIASLKSKQLVLEKESSQLKVKTKSLEEENLEAKQIIDSTALVLDSVEQEKLETQEYIEKRERLIKSLNSEKQREAIVKKQLEQELQLTKLATEKQKLVIERNRNFRKYLIALSGLVLLAALSFYLRYRAKRKANQSLEKLNREIKKEQEKSEELLLNILPESVAQELKLNNTSEARSYPDATVLFTDFKDFTTIAEKMTPEELVSNLDECFRAFDYIIAEHNIEKIKTIGDAYMCANGISDKPNKPGSVIKAALEFQKFLAETKRERLLEGKPYFEARIGVHTGPVVAGVVGVKKFAYDIWGDTVNIAARMESACDPGKINISDATYQKIRYDFDCNPRGELEVKNKGRIKMYYVNSKY